MAAGLPPARVVDALVTIGRLEFADFIRLDDLTLCSVLADIPAESVTDLLVRHPALLRRAQQHGRWSSGPIEPTRPTGPTGRNPDIAQALVRAHAFDLLAAKSPALYEALPWFDWDTSVALRGRTPWQSRFLLAGDSATITACRLRRAAGVTIAEPRPRLADYARRKLQSAGVKRWEVSTEPFAALVRAGGYDLAVLTLPLGIDPAELFPRIPGPACVLALRPGVEKGIVPPDGWRALAVRTAAGLRPGWATSG